MLVRLLKIGLSLCFMTTQAKAIDLNDVIDFLGGEKEYAAYECPSLADAEVCGSTCKAWTVPKIVFKLEEAKNQLVIKWIDNFQTIGNCSVLNKRNWQCERSSMTYIMKNGHIIRRYILNSGYSNHFLYACFK